MRITVLAIKPRTDTENALHPDVSYYQVSLTANAQTHQFRFKVSTTRIGGIDIRIVSAEDEEFWQMFDHFTGDKIVKLVSKIYNKRQVDFPVDLE